MKRESQEGICMNTGRTHFLKGCVPWNKGLAGTGICRSVKGRIPWNKGLTKDTNKTVAEIGRQNSIVLTGRPMPKPSNYSEIMRKVNPPRRRKRLNRGYIMIYKPDYEGSMKTTWDKGRILEHKYVMEQHIGRLLTKGEVVHHLDGNKENNVIENLVLCANASMHTKLHMAEQRFVEQLIKTGKVYFDEIAFTFVLR